MFGLGSLLASDTMARSKKAKPTKHVDEEDDVPPEAEADAPELPPLVEVDVEAELPPCCWKGGYWLGNW